MLRWSRTRALGRRQQLRRRVRRLCDQSGKDPRVPLLVPPTRTQSLRCDDAVPPRRPQLLRRMLIRSVDAWRGTRRSLVRRRRLS
jgi:hypothetical protein